ncbi:MAG: MerR family transcriptional regulator [Jatrophihabitans sp.]
MRISELAANSGLSVATIKFYLRKGLLPAGEPVSRTQSDYAEEHLLRLRLIRSLREIAGLSVDTIATVLKAVDDEQLPLVDLLGITQNAVARPASTGTDHEPASRLLADLGWQLSPGSSLVGSLAAVLEALAAQDEAIDCDSLRPWADAAWAVAEVEVGYITDGDPRPAAARRVAVGTLLYGELLAQLRLAAQEAVSVGRFGPVGATLAGGPVPDNGPVADGGPADGTAAVAKPAATGKPGRRGAFSRPRRGTPAG